MVFSRLFLFFVFFFLNVDLGAKPVGLELSDQQKVDIKKIRDSYRGEIQAKRKILKSKQEALQRAMQGAAKDDQLISLFEALQSAKRSLARTQFEELLKMRAHLDADQRSRLRQLQREFEGSTRFKPRKSEQPESEADSQ